MLFDHTKFQQEVEAYIKQLKARKRLRRIKQAKKERELIESQLLGNSNAIIY